jgi:hypothetical protein
LCFFLFPVLLTSSSLFSYPYSYPLHFPFFCTTIHCSPSQILFLFLLIHSFSCLHISLLFYPNLSPHHPSLLHTHYLLTSPMHNGAAIPDTNTLH